MSKRAFLPAIFVLVFTAVSVPQQFFSPASNPLLFPAQMKLQITDAGVPYLSITDFLPVYQEVLTQYWKNNAWKDSTKDITTIDTVKKEVTTIAMSKSGTAFVNSMKVFIVYRQIANNLIYFSKFEVYMWAGTDWALYSRSTYTYDGNGFLTEIRGEANLGTGLILISLENYTNNPQGQPTLIVTQELNFSTMTMKNKKKYTNTYGANGLDLLTELEARWVDPQWRDTAKTVFTRNANHDPLTEEEFILVNNGAQTLKNAFIERTYDASFNELTYLRKSWNSTASAYKDNYRETWTYNTSNQKLTEYFETYNGTAWVPTERWTNTYSGGNPKLEFGERYANSVWSNYKQQLYFYTASSVELSGVRPYALTLDQNYPNPFNPSTTIKYRLPYESTISLKVYDALGNEAATLASGVQKSGAYSVVFDGSALPSGIYFCRLLSESSSATIKIMLMK